MSDTTVYLISGSNRGIGLSMVKSLANDPANVIFAGARAPAKATALHDLAKTSQAKIHVIELVSADEEGNKKAAEEVQKIAGRVDVIIANAGLSSPDGMLPMSESKSDQWTTHFDVNVTGVVLLYKQFYSLLKASKVAPKFIPISSVAGSIELAPMMDWPIGVYGASKAALNFLTIKIHLESEEFGLIAFPLHPGVVATDMLTGMVGGHDGEGERPTSITPDESAEAILKLTKEATRETHGGKFWGYDGTVMPF